MQTERTLKIDIGGKPYFITSDDDYLDGIAGGFEPQTVKLLRALAPRDGVHFDVGANIGCTAIVLAEHAKQVYAFEPSPTTFAFLEKNVNEAGLQHQVSLWNCGLRAEHVNLPLTYAQSNRSGGFISDRTTTSAGHEIETIKIHPLDALIRTMEVRRLDLIKIDVEGFEGHVLRGAKATLAEFRPIVALELNHWCLNAFQRTSVPDFLDFLRSIFPIIAGLKARTTLTCTSLGSLTW